MDCWERNMQALKELCQVAPEDKVNLRNAFLFIYLFNFGFSFLNYVIHETGQLWCWTGVIGGFYSGFVYYADQLVILAWSLWMHFGVLLILSGITFRSVSYLVSDSLIAVGLVILVFIWIAPCFGYKVCNRRRPQQNGYAVVYQPPLEEV